MPSLTIATAQAATFAIGYQKGDRSKRATVSHIANITTNKVINAIKTIVTILNFLDSEKTLR